MMPPIPTGSDGLLDIMAEACKGRPDAYKWFAGLLQLSFVLDDLRDGDELDRRHAERAIVAVAVGWGTNPFYLQHSAVLSSALWLAWKAWSESDTDPLLRCKAFDVATEVGSLVALLVLGYEGAEEISGRLRRWAFVQMKKNDAKG